MSKMISLQLPSIATQLASIATKLVRVWHYDDTTDTWLMYDPADPSLYSLTRLEDGKAYWIMISGTCTINYAYLGRTYNYPLIAVVPAMSYLVWGTGVTDPPTDGGDDPTPTPGGFDISAMIGPLMMVMMMGMIMPMMTGGGMFGED